MSELAPQLSKQIPVETVDAAARPAVPDPIGAALAASGVGVWQWDSAAGTFAVSPACQAHFGDAAELFEAIHPDDREICAEALKCGAPFDIWVRVGGTDGAEPRWVEMRGREIDDTGRVTGITMDVTEHCRAVGALTEPGHLQCGFAHARESEPVSVPGADGANADQLAEMNAQADDQLSRLKNLIARGVSAVISGR